MAKKLLFLSSIVLVSSLSTCLLNPAKANAGEGGIAAATSFLLNNDDPSNPFVVGVSAAAAIGKRNAGALATTTTGGVSASAIGSGGIVTIEGFLDATNGPKITADMEDDLTGTQENTFTNNFSIQIGTQKNDKIIEYTPNPATP